MRRPLGLALLLLAAAPAAGQSFPVTFRFLPDLSAPPIPDVVRAFLPGSFNDWGPNADGVIAIGAPSQMTLDAGLAEWRYTRTFATGDTAFYKVHYHRNASGSSYEWITDPLSTGPCVRGQFGSDCRIEVADPMLFQLAREENSAGHVAAVSAGVFGSEQITALSFSVNGEARDGMPHFDAATGILRFVLPEPVATAVFAVTATDALNRTVTRQVGFPPPVVVDAPVPAGMLDGINLNPSDPTRATLVLLAPGKAFVHLVGDATGWEVSNDYLLKRDQAGPRGTRWWVELTGLTPGEAHRYQYLVEGEDRISDPYAELVLDASNDPFITPATFPDLPPYPLGLTTDLVSVMRTGAAPYGWTPFTRPAQQDLVIYELLVRDFVAAHDFATVEDTLDYLEELGITAIELMPVSEFDGNINWGYGPNHYFAVDKYYGPPDRLRHLIDHAHQRGIAVLLDVVYNHQTGQAPFVRLYNEGAYGPPTPDNPWVNPTARHPFNVFNDNNHESLATQDWLDRANRFWLEEFNVDGFRFDLSKGFVQTCGGGTCTDGNWGQFNQGRINLLTRMANAIWEVDATAYIVLEHFADWSEERVLANHGRAQGHPGMLLWHNMNRNYSQSAMGYLSDGSFSSALNSAYPPNNTFPLDGQIAYMESHDEQWLMYRNRAYGPQNGSYDVRDLATALSRQELVAAFFLTVPGPKMIWQFGELGYGWGDAGEQCLQGTGDTCPPAAPGRTDPKPIRWDYYQVPERLALYETYRALLYARNANAIFRSPDAVAMQVGQGQPDRWIKLTLGADTVVVVGNFGLVERTWTPPLHAGVWHDYFGRTSFVYQDMDSITLAPGEFRVLSTSALVFPPPVANEPSVAHEPLVLGAPFPNPAAGAVTVPFTLARAGAVRLEAYDALGRRVAVLVAATLAAGAHRAVLDGAQLPAGVYLLRLETAAATATLRLTLIR